MSNLISTSIGFLSIHLVTPPRGTNARRCAGRDTVRLRVTAGPDPPLYIKMRDARRIKAQSAGAARKGDGGGASLITESLPTACASACLNDKSTDSKIIKRYTTCLMREH